MQIKRRWNLNIPSTTETDGAEAITFVADENAAEGGYFLVGSQHNGKTYIFELPVKNAMENTQTWINKLDSYKGISSLKNIAALTQADDLLLASYPSGDQRRVFAFRIFSSTAEEGVEYLDDPLRVGTYFLPITDAEALSTAPVQIKEGTQDEPTLFQAYAASDNMHVLEMLSFKETQAGGFSVSSCLSETRVDDT